MPANISSNSVDLDVLFAAHVTNNAANLTGYQVSGVDIQSRYDIIANPALPNAGARLPPTSIVTSAPGWSNTDLASIFCGNASQYSISVPAGGTQSVAGWVSPKVWTHTITVTFASASALTNYFFYGGRIQLSPTQGTGTLADNTLATMFSDMGTLIIYDTGHYRTGTGGIITSPGIGGTNTGTTSVPLYNTTDGTPYSNTTYTVSMVANAPAGTATVLTITATLNVETANASVDIYTGTYTSNVQQRNHPTVPAPVFSSTLTDVVLGPLVEYLLVAGGGGGASNWFNGASSGGGGAGGYRSSVQGELSGGNSVAESPVRLIVGQVYPVVVGSGGAPGATDNNQPGSSGTNTTFAGIVALGGGGGGSSVLPNISGGSGGGAPAGGFVAGTGAANQGFAGGIGQGPNDYRSGGGGGAGGIGQSGPDGSNGGPGLPSTITGTQIYRAGGGAGGRFVGGTGVGGIGGGGSSQGGSAVPNTGGGGAGTRLSASAGSGASGVAIFRYLGTQQATGGTVTSANGYTIHTFLTSGNLVAEAAFVYNHTISSNVNNFNMRTTALANGWDGIRRLDMTVTVNSGVVIGSTSTANPSFDTDINFPVGSTLSLVNNGFIVGAGGTGGGASVGVSGLNGGSAIRAARAVTIQNNGTIGGGGGGGGLGAGVNLFGDNWPGGGGGGGAGSIAGLGSVPYPPTGTANAAAAGSNGSTTTGGPGGWADAFTPGEGYGGAGGGLGASGQNGIANNIGIVWYSAGNGGSGGNCTTAGSNANITWTNTGTRLGTIG